MTAPSIESTSAASSSPLPVEGRPTIDVFAVKARGENPSAASAAASATGAMSPPSLSSSGGVATPLKFSGFSARRSSSRVKGVVQHPFTRDSCVEYFVRQHYTAPTYIEESSERGRYVCAGGFLPRGAYVCEYGGQLVSSTEGSVREGRYAQAGDALYGCYSYFFTHPSSRLEHCFDATAERPEYGIGRLLSHGKKAPNIDVRALVLDGIPHLVLTARNDIPFGTELLFDYGDRRLGALEQFTWLKK
jgi:histone-lysine N-methyltransferase SETD8